MTSIVKAAYLATLLAASGCAQGASATQPLELVPADAVVTLELVWRDVSTTPALRPLAVLPPALEEFSSLGPLDSVVIFSRSLSSATGDETAILTAQGIGRRFTAAAGGQGWSAESVNGTTIYVRSGTLAVAAASLSDDLLIAGSTQAVRHLVMSRRTTGAFVSKPEFAEVREAFRDGSPVRLAVAWPLNVSDASKAAVAASAGLLNLTGWESIGSVVGRLGIGRAYVVRLKPESTGLRLNVTGVMEDEATATMVAGGLSLLKGLAAFVPDRLRNGEPDPTATLTVERTGRVLSVGMLLSENGTRP